MAPEQPPPSREAFYAELERRCREFSLALLRDIPELEAIAIVPSFTVQSTSLPVNYLRGRNGPLQTPNEIMHMAVQLHGSLSVVMLAALQMIGDFDAQMSELVRKAQAELELIRQHKGPLDGPD